MNDYRVYKFSKKEELIYILGLLIFGLLMGELFYGNPFGSMVMIPGYFALKKPLSAYLTKKRGLKIRDQFRDTLYSFSASFATGRHILDAMKEAYPYVAEIHGKDAIMAMELKNMAYLIETAGAGEVELWQDLAERSGLEDILDFASVFKACRDTGGDMVGAVDRAAKVIGEKIAIENEIRTMSAQRKMEGRVIGIMPAVIIAFLNISGAGYMDIMYSTMLGRIVMTLALITMAVAIYMTERITDIKV